MPTTSSRRKPPGPPPQLLGKRTLRCFFPDLYGRVRRGTLTLDRARQIALRALRILMATSVPHWLRHDTHLIEDLTMDLVIRIATMRATARFDPRRAKAWTYLRGVTRTLVGEKLFRRQPPRPISGDALEHVIVDGDQLSAWAHREQLAELQDCIDKLSPGEIRALTEAVGPLGKYGCEVPRPGRDRCLDPEALPRAVEILDKLRVLMTRQ